MTKTMRVISIILLLHASAPVTVVAEETAGQPALPLEELRTFTDVFSKIKSDYVETVDDKTLLENAVRGMLEGLDPHSTFLKDEAYRDLRDGTAGEFGGLGIEVGMENGFVKVIAPLDDTPAHRAGIKAGDLIIKLDDQSIKGMALHEAVNLMRGEPGQSITLTIIREQDEQPLTFTLIRETIKIKSVRSEILEPGFAYLRISRFQARTVENLYKAVRGIRMDSEEALKGVVLDLRNNPGGILEAAIDVADVFLDSGLIAYTDGRTRESKLEFKARPNSILPRVPLVVLVNAGSASGAEIVAGAIQDHGRGVIMGEKTFGKGSVQTVLPMRKNAALKLTTARYYTPNGRSIQASGIAPDVVIDKVRVSLREDPFDTVVKEADLRGHLEGVETGEIESEDATPIAAENVNDSDGDKDQRPLSLRDYELYEALNLLKGLAIINK